MSTNLGVSPVVLRLCDVKARTGLSRSSIYSLMKSEVSPFPKSIHISIRAVGWLESDINDFIQSRINACRNAI